MTWSEAKLYLQAAHGNKVRRSKSWPAGVFIEYRIPDNVHEPLVYLNLPYVIQRVETGDLVPWCLSPSDPYASDWEIVPS